jgi:hypothetical protein
MDVKVREEARKAFLDALKWQAEEYGSMLDWLNPERGMSGVRLDGTWDFNAALDAYEAALKAAGYVMVPREATVAMAEAGSIWTEGDYAPEYVGNAYKVWTAMIEAATNPAP